MALKWKVSPFIVMATIGDKNSEPRSLRVTLAEFGRQVKQIAKDNKREKADLLVKCVE